MMQENPSGTAEEMTEETPAEEETPRMRRR
jgi:hypothetical protein